MLLKILVIIAVGIVGAIINSYIFNKKIMFPRYTKNELGRELEFNFLGEIICCVAVAFLMSAPVLNTNLPETNLAANCFIPAIAGSELLKVMLAEYFMSRKAKTNEEMNKFKKAEEEKEESEEEKRA